MPSLEKAFRRGWKSGGVETSCGAGSTLAATSRLRRWLPDLLDEFGISSINDAGCGDLNWMSTMDLTSFDYLGVDIVAHDSWNNIASKSSFRVYVADICNNELRAADLTICRDVLIHLPNALVVKALRNFRLTSRYLLSTSFEEGTNLERNILPGGYGQLDLKCEPFNLGNPILMTREKHRGKYLGLWELVGNKEDQCVSLLSDWRQLKAPVELS